MGGLLEYSVSASPIPFPLDFGFWNWIWDLDLGLGFGTGLGLDNLFNKVTLCLANKHLDKMCKFLLYWRQNIKIISSGSGQIIM